MGSTSFRALAWLPEVVHDEVLALSAPRWILVKNIPPFLWQFLPHLLEPLGKTIRMDNSVRLVPHMDARILISLLPGKEIPSNVVVNILNDSYVCPIEVLGKLNACFLCCKEGHLRKDCPIIRKDPTKNPNPLIPNPSIKTSSSIPIPDSNKSISPEITFINHNPISVLVASHS